MRIFPFLILALLVLGGVSYGGEGLRVTNEMIYEKLLEVEKRLVQLERRQAVLEAQFREFREWVDKRFEQVDRRFQETRADMNARFEQLYTFLWIITGIFTALVAVVIGFALWDRRTTIRRAREEAFEKVEAEGRWRLVLQALRELAREDRRLAEVLRSFGLL